MEYVTEIAELEQVWRSHVTGEPCAQLAQWRQREPDVEVRMSAPTLATQQVLIAVCKRYGLRLYRLPRQHRSTLCVQAPASFMDQVLHPLLQGMAQIVEGAAHRTTLRVIDGWSQRCEESSS